jgi:hypothetical protein
VERNNRLKENILKTVREEKEKKFLNIFQLTNNEFIDESLDKNSGVKFQEIWFLSLEDHSMSSALIVVDLGIHRVSARIFWSK